MQGVAILGALAWLACSATSAIAQDSRSPAADHLKRGLDLLRHEKLEEAKAALLESLRLEPNRAEVHNVLGSIFDRLGQTDEAIRCYLRATELNPTIPATYNNLGIAYLRKEEFDRARAAFRQALRLAPDNVSGHYNLGLLYLRERRLPDAVEHLENALRKSPDDLGILFNLGTAYLEQEKPEACVRLFEAVPADGPASRIPEIQLLLGTALARVNRLDEAIVRLAEAARLRPDAGEAHYRLGLVFQKKGEWMEARSRMEKAIELNPSAPAEYFLALGEIYGNLALSDKAVDAFKRSLAKQDSALAHIGLGSIYLDTRQYGQAIAEFEEAAKKNPSSAEAALNLATALHRAGKHHEALDRLRSLEANTTFKRTRLYYQILSGVAAKLEQWGQALEALKQASELEPGAVELYFQMGLLLLNAGALQEATLLLSRVAERFPESATVQVGLAQAYIAGDRSDLAESRLLETIRKSPEYDEPYYLLGNCYQESNRLDLALPYYQKAIARNPNRADFHFSLGLTYLRLGERDKALDHFRKAQELEPSAETLYRIASIHVEKNSLTEAQSALQKAIEAEPDHPQSRYLLFRIYSRRGEKSEAERELRIFESLKKKEEGRGGKPGGPDLKPVDYYLGSLK